MSSALSILNFGKIELVDGLLQLLIVGFLLLTRNIIFSTLPKSMAERSCSENRNPFRNRFVSYTTVGLYVFALIILPVLHGHSCEHPVETSSEHSEPAPGFPDSDDSCPICAFAVLIVPFLMAYEPLLEQTITFSELSCILLILPVVDVTDLPPCRASPVV